MLEIIIMTVSIINLLTINQKLNLTSNESQNMNYTQFLDIIDECWTYICKIAIILSFKTRIHTWFILVSFFTIL